MLGLLSKRLPKPWIVSSQILSLHHHPQFKPPASFNAWSHSYNATADGGVFIWRMIVPTAIGGGDWRKDYLRLALLHQHDRKGEGSWNVAWDVRPARWLHRVDLAWLLFGVCLCLAPIDRNDVVNHDDGDRDKDIDSPGYRVTGVPADGRCLFRAIAHGACLRSGEEAPDENRQRELADELRARVVDELLKRREEVEWFIEGDFDAYVKRIQQPYIWGGEPELLMASHYLKTSISVYMKERSTGKLTNIANYGEEYQKEKEPPINVLFYGYGHYDILETSLHQNSEKGNE